MRYLNTPTAGFFKKNLIYLQTSFAFERYLLHRTLSHRYLSVHVKRKLAEKAM